MDTLTTFMIMYQQFSKQIGIDLDHSCRTDTIAVAFETKVKEISYTRKRAENLLSRIQNTRTLVSITLDISAHSDHPRFPLYWRDAAVTTSTSKYRLFRSSKSKGKTKTQS